MYTYDAKRCKKLLQEIKVDQKTNYDKETIQFLINEIEKVESQKHKLQSNDFINWGFETEEDVIEFVLEHFDFYFEDKKMPMAKVCSEPNEYLPCTKEAEVEAFWDFLYEPLRTMERYQEIGNLYELKGLKKKNTSVKPQLRNIFRICPSCLSTLSYGDKYCKNCGQKLNWDGISSWEDKNGIDNN